MKDQNVDNRKARRRPARSLGPRELAMMTGGIKHVGAITWMTYDEDEQICITDGS